MVSLNELPLLALGALVSAGLGFLFWMLCHLTGEANSRSRARRSR